MARFVDKKLAIGLGISLFFLVLLFRKIEFDKLAAAFRELDYRYLLPAVAATFASYYCRALRWRLLLLPLKRTAIVNLYPATIIGYMANNLLPARLGEFVRAYVLGMKEGLESSSVFATLVVDRLWDGFTVLVILLITVFTIKLPPGMETVQQGMVVGGYVTLGIYLGAITFLIVLKRATGWTLHMVARILKPFPASVEAKVIPLLGSFIAGIKVSARPLELAALVGISAAIWLLAAWPVDLVLRSFGLTLPFNAALFILVFLVFAVMVPASPGFVGTYHAACVYGLKAFNVPMEKALSIALVMHAINFFPVIVVGLYYLWRDKLSLKVVSAHSVPEGGNR